MSETDSFIREVSEEVRQDRMFRLWKRYGLFVIGGVALAVGGTGVWTWMQHQATAERAERGAAFLAVEEGDVEGARRLADSTEGLRRVIAELKLAQALSASGDRAGAAEAYQAVADRADAPARYADFARLEALRLRAAEADPEDTIAALAPLAEAGAPYRALALELRAALHLNAGRPEAARSDLEAIMADPAATAATRARAEALLATFSAAG